jgi:hypothetical protein
MIVATLRLGLAPGTLCVISETRSVRGCIPTQSVGTITTKASRAYRGTWRNANLWDRL